MDFVSESLTQDTRALAVVSRRHCESCAFSLALRSFLVDGYSCRGNMRCKARPELCGTDRLLPHDAVPHLNDRLLQRDALPRVFASKPFRIRTSKKCVCKAFGICTCKIIGLKVLPISGAESSKSQQKGGDLKSPHPGFELIFVSYWEPTCIEN